MIILGLDPGLAILGYGVIEAVRDQMRLVDYGAVTTDKSISEPNRLRLVQEGVEDLMRRYAPEHVAVEELFFNSNAKTAIMIGQARGVILAGAARFTEQIYEYTPLQVKQTTVGYGRAEKKQIQQMVKLLLRLQEIPRPDDAADALAVAICHARLVNVGHIFKIQ